MAPLILHNVRDFVTRVDAVMEMRDHGGDFVVYRAAGKLYEAHRDASAYDVEWMYRTEISLHLPLGQDPVWQAQRGQRLRQPPLVLPVLQRVASFFPSVGFMLFTLAEAFLLAALLAGTTRWAARSSGPVGGAAWVLFCLGWAQPWQAFHYAQLPAVVAATAFTAGVALLRRGYPLEAGLCWALMLLKLPFYFLPLALYLGLTRQGRGLAGLGLGAAVVTVLSGHVVGLAGLAAYLKSQLDAPRGLYFAGYDLMLNWRGLAERCLGAWPALIVPAELGAVLLTWVAAGLAWREPAEGWRRDGQLVILALVMVVAAPVTHGHDLLLLLPALGLAAREWWDRPAFVLSCGLLAWCAPLGALRNVVVVVLVGVLAGLVRQVRARSR